MRFILFILIAILNGQHLPFQLGEKLVYSAKFNIIPSGYASLEVLGHESINGVGTYHARFKASTNPTLDRLYKLRDQVDIWLDETDLFTHQLKKNLREGNYHKKIYTIIHYDESQAIINSDTVAITEPVRDPYSLFYYLRSIPLNVGQLLEFTSFENKKTTPFKLAVTGKETIKTRAGTFNCLVVKPFQQGKALFKNEGDMQIWFSDDEKRLPVQIHIKLKFGSMHLKLKEVVNQKVD
ncbi:MAG: DUF3108 domain-containing protein [Candidatus Marinimicrobia bacterium]|nr:DUF3108 domain-containing protein [Candidatus Neomarinimicrobiota bacterium]